MKLVEFLMTEKQVRNLIGGSVHGLVDFDWWISAWSGGL